MDKNSHINSLPGSGKRSNYDIMAEDARILFSEMDAEGIMRRTGIIPQDGAYRMTFLGRTYCVDAKDGTVTREDGEPAGNTVPLILYDILGYSVNGASPSGQYTQVQNLSGLVSGLGFAGQGMFDRTVAEMDGRDLQLRRACEALGGTPWGKGDVSYRIPLCMDLDFVFSFWDSDDEFPASASVLFDRNSLMYMHYETLWYCMGKIFSRINEEMEKLR